MSCVLPVPLSHTCLFESHHMRLSVGLPGSCDASMLSLGLQAMKVLWPVQQVFGFLPETLKALKKGHDIAFVSRDLAVHTHTDTGFTMFHP